MSYSEGVHQTARSPNDWYIQGWTFPVYSYMMVLHSAVVTTSVYMRVSHSGKTNLKIPEILEIFWPAAVTCREATIMHSDTIFPVPILRISAYLPCKYVGMGMHSVDTLVCQIWAKYRWIMEIAGQNVLLWRGLSNGYISKRLIDTGLNLSGVFLYDGATLRCSYNVCLYAGQSQREVKFDKFLKFLKYFDLQRRHVERQLLSIVTLYLLRLSYVYLPTYPVNMNAWACIV